MWWSEEGGGALGLEPRVKLANCLDRLSTSRCWLSERAAKRLLPPFCVFNDELEGRDELAEVWLGSSRFKARGLLVVEDTSSGAGAILVSARVKNNPIFEWGLDPDLLIEHTRVLSLKFWGTPRGNVTTFPWEHAWKYQEHGAEGESCPKFV